MLDRGERLIRKRGYRETVTKDLKICQSLKAVYNLQGTIGSRRLFC